MTTEENRQRVVGQKMVKTGVRSRTAAIRAQLVEIKDHVDAPGGTQNAEASTKCTSLLAKIDSLTASVSD